MSDKKKTTVREVLVEVVKWGGWALAVIQYILAHLPS
jgi:hypothetical protein